MIAFILRRLLYIIPVLAGVIAITLTLFFSIASDPVLAIAGQNPTEEDLQAKREKYQLDRPALFDAGWLRGEDILESKRRIRLEVIIDKLSDEVTAGNIKPQDVDNFRRDWRRNRVSEIGDYKEEINNQLASMGADEAIRINYDGLELNEEEQAKADARSIFDAQFFRVARFDFADSMIYEESIWDLIWRKAPISLSITIPMFLIGLAIELTLSLFAASKRGQAIDTIITIIAVLAMSVPFLSYAIFGQWFAASTKLFPVSGWEPGFAGVRYLAFPIAIGVLAGIGSAVRFYRAVLLEEMDRDYVRTARAKGVKQLDVLFVHVLRNAGIPIVTRLSVIVPFLITGSLLIEKLFEIPGLGQLMLSGITSRDFWIVMPLTYLLSVVYAVAVLLTDIVYALIDPRVRVTS